MAPTMPGALDTEVPSLCGLPCCEPSFEVVPLRANSTLQCCACKNPSPQNGCEWAFEIVQLLVRKAETNFKVLCRILRVPFKKKNGEVLQKWVSR